MDDGLPKQETMTREEYDNAPRIPLPDDGTWDTLAKKPYDVMNDVTSLFNKIMDGPGFDVEASDLDAQTRK